MKLPHRHHAIIKPIKITGYLLSLEHKDGKSKANFFRRIGYNETNIKQFEKDLLNIAKNYDVLEVDNTKETIVIKYVIKGDLIAPNGRKYTIKTVWAIEVGSKIPHLVTAPY